jgi:hypothetical protein
MGDHDRQESLRGLLVLGSGVSGIGCAVPMLVLIAIFVGRYLDDLLGTAPWILLGLLLDSIVLGVGLMITSAFSATRTAQHRYMEHRQRAHDTTDYTHDRYGEER